MNSITRRNPNKEDIDSVVLKFDSIDGSLLGIEALATAAFDIILVEFRPGCLEAEFLGSRQHTVEPAWGSPFASFTYVDADNNEHLLDGLRKAGWKG